MNKIQEIWFIYKNKIIASAFVAVLGVSLFVFVYFFNISKAKAESNSVVIEKKEVSSSSNNTNEILIDSIKVDIKGEVKKPGMYQIKNDSRVQDLISLAGGLTQNADTSVINLSKKLYDEMVVIIYSKNEVKGFLEIKEKETVNNTKCKNDEILHNDVCISNSADNKEIGNKVNINNASVQDLMSISGIGESKARAIVEYRNQNGLFRDISEIKNVSGIGEALFEKIKSNITV